MAQRTKKVRRGTGYKFSSGKTGKKTIGEKRKIWQFRKVRTLSHEQALEEGIVMPVLNPHGRVYLWFRHGEKKCWDTKQKFDPDGFSRFGILHPKAYKFLKFIKRAAVKFDGYVATGQLV